MASSSVAYSVAAAAFPDVATPVERGLTEAGRAERAAVHVHDFAGRRPRSRLALEVVVAASCDAGEAIETTVVRLSADAAVRGVREFADTLREVPPTIDASALLAEEALGELAGAGPWEEAEVVDFVTILATPPPPSPSRLGGTALFDRRTGRLLYAASVGAGGRYVGPT